MAIGLGSNLGDRLAHLRDALEALDRLVADLRVAPIYRTRPIRRSGVVPADWPDYLNTAATGRTRLGPEDLLAGLKRIELTAGRRRAERDAPRPVDLDLLLYDDMVVDRPELTLPHPGLTSRLFVLAPLAVIAPEWRIPGEGAAVADLLERCSGATPIERLEWPGGEWRRRC